jgi:hypothetical protein
MDNMKIFCEVLFKDKALTQLVISRKNLGTEGALVVAEYLDGNRALSVLTFGDKFNLYDGKGEQDGVVTIDTTMTEADFSNKNLGVGGDIIVSAWLIHKDNGALTSLDLASNNLGAPLFPAGWTYHPNNIDSHKFMHTDSSHQEAAPEGTTYTLVLPLLPTPSPI